MKTGQGVPVTKTGKYDKREAIKKKDMKRDMERLGKLK